jgi:hypothetical protein
MEPPFPSNVELVEWRRCASAAFSSNARTFRDHYSSLRRLFPSISPLVTQGIAISAEWFAPILRASSREPSLGQAAEWPDESNSPVDYPDPPSPYHDPVCQTQTQETPLLSVEADMSAGLSTVGLTGLLSEPMSESFGTVDNSHMSTTQLLSTEIDMPADTSGIKPTELTSSRPLESIAAVNQPGEPRTSPPPAGVDDTSANVRIERPTSEVDTDLLGTPLPGGLFSEELDMNVSFTLGEVTEPEGEEADQEPTSDQPSKTENASMLAGDPPAAPRSSLLITRRSGTSPAARIVPANAVNAEPQPMETIASTAAAEPLESTSVVSCPPKITSLEPLKPSYVKLDRIPVKQTPSQNATSQKRTRASSPKSVGNTATKRPSSPHGSEDKRHRSLKNDNSETRHPTSKDSSTREEVWHHRLSHARAEVHREAALVNSTRVEKLYQLKQSVSTGKISPDHPSLEDRIRDILGEEPSKTPPPPPAPMSPHASLALPSTSRIPALMDVVVPPPANLLPPSARHGSTGQGTARRHSESGGSHNVRRSPPRNAEPTYGQESLRATMTRAVSAGIEIPPEVEAFMRRVDAVSSTTMRRPDDKDHQKKKDQGAKSYQSRRDRD